MTSNAEPITPGWRLVRDEEKLVIYTSNKLGISLILTRYNTCWHINQVEIITGMITKIDKARSKSGAITKAKDYVELHPLPSDEVMLRGMRMKSPEKAFEVPKVNPRFSRRE